MDRSCFSETSRSAQHEGDCVAHAALIIMPPNLAFYYDTNYHRLLPMLRPLRMLIGVLVLSCLAGSFSWGQTNDTPKANTLYAELGGSAVVYNVGYDRLLYVDGRNKLAIAAGFGYLPADQITPGRLSISPQVSYLHGRLHHLELGIGTIHSRDMHKSAAVTLRIGYRYQRSDGGTFFKAGFTPIFYGIELSDRVYPVFPWGGFAFGWTF